MGPSLQLTERKADRTEVIRGADKMVSRIAPRVTAAKFVSVEEAGNPGVSLEQARMQVSQLLKVDVTAVQQSLAGRRNSEEQ